MTLSPARRHAGTSLVRSHRCRAAATATFEPSASGDRPRCGSSVRPACPLATLSARASRWPETERSAVARPNRSGGLFAPSGRSTNWPLQATRLWWPPQDSLVAPFDRARLQAGTRLARMLLASVSSSFTCARSPMFTASTPSSVCSPRARHPARWGARSSPSWPAPSRLAGVLAGRGRRLGLRRHTSTRSAAPGSSSIARGDRRGDRRLPPRLRRRLADRTLRRPASCSSGTAASSHVTPPRLDRADAWFERWDKPGVLVGTTQRPSSARSSPIPAGLFEIAARACSSAWPLVPARPSGRSPSSASATASAPSYQSFPQRLPLRGVRDRTRPRSCLRWRIWSTVGGLRRVDASASDGRFCRLQTGASRRPRSRPYRSGMDAPCVLALLGFRSAEIDRTHRHVH